MIKKILVPMGGVSERSRHLDAALGLARRFNAHVDALHAALDPRDSVAYLGDGMTGTMISQVMAAAEKESEERAAKAKKVFSDTCTELGVAVSDDPTAQGRLERRQPVFAVLPDARMFLWRTMDDFLI